MQAEGLACSCLGKHYHHPPRPTPAENSRAYLSVCLPLTWYLWNTISGNVLGRYQWGHRIYLVQKKVQDSRLPGAEGQAVTDTHSGEGLAGAPDCMDGMGGCTLKM